MMLPEHKSAMSTCSKDQHKRSRINLDDKEWEDISRIIAGSLKQRIPIKFKMFHELEDLEVNGIVDRVDQHQSRFMVDGECFRIKDIEGAEIEH